MSWFKQQGEFHPSAPFYAWDNPAFPFPKGHIFLIYIPVAAFQLAYQPAFGILPASQQPVWSHMIGETGKKNRITTETAEHPAQLPHVSTEQAVALCAAYLMGQPFTGQQFVPVSYVGQVPFLTMPALEIMISYS